MNFSRLLAGRYLNPARSIVSAITLISLIGVVLGVAILIIVVSIHAGFARDVKKLMLGFAPHLEVHSMSGTMADWDELEKEIAKSESVTGSYALLQDFVLMETFGQRKPVYFRAIETDDEEQIAALDALLDKDGYPGSRADMGLDQFAVISRQLAKDLGLNVGDEVEVYASRNFEEVKLAFDRTSVEPLYVRRGEDIAEIKKLVAASRAKANIPVTELQGLHRKINEVVGAGARDVEFELADTALRVLESFPRDETGNFYLTTPEGWTKLQAALDELTSFDVEAADAKSLKNIGEIVLPKKLTIWGVYGDSQRTPGPQMFIPLIVGQELSGYKDRVQAVAVRLDEPFEAFIAAEELNKQLGEDYVVIPWMERHKVQFQLLKTERWMLTFVLSFLGLISAFSITAVMLTVTVQKRKEIGVMKALGATRSQISWVFLWQGLFVGLVGAIGGIAFAMFFIWQRENVQLGLRKIGVDPFPSDFQGFDKLPAEVSWPFVLLIALAAWILCGVAALIPALKAAHDDAAKSLRNI